MEIPIEKIAMMYLSLSVKYELLVERCNSQAAQIEQMSKEIELIKKAGE